MNKKPTYEELEQRVKDFEKEVVAQAYLDIAGVIIVVLNADQQWPL